MTFLQAQILQWVEFCDSTIRPTICAALHVYLGMPVANGCTLSKDIVHLHENSLQKELVFLNKVFLRDTFLVGERLSLADITLFSLLLPAYLYILDPVKQETYINLTRWFNTVSKYCSFFIDKVFMVYTNFVIAIVSPGTASTRGY